MLDSPEKAVVATLLLTSDAATLILTNDGSKKSVQLQASCTSIWPMPQQWIGMPSSDTYAYVHCRDFPIGDTWLRAPPTFTCVHYIIYSTPRSRAVHQHLLTAILLTAILLTDLWEELWRNEAYTRPKTHRWVLTSGRWIRWHKYIESVTMSECPDCSSKYHYTLSDKGSERKENVNRDWSPGS